MQSESLIFSSILSIDESLDSCSSMSLPLHHHHHHLIGANVVIGIEDRETWAKLSASVGVADDFLPVAVVSAGEVPPAAERFSEGLEGSLVGVAGAGAERGGERMRKRGNWVDFHGNSNGD